MRKPPLNSRMSLITFQLALLLVLAAGVTLTPDRLGAQPSQAAGDQATTPQPAPGSEAAAEEQGENAYRHSAIIKSTAKVLHISTETAARTFEILNIAVVIFGIGIPLYRFLPKYLRGRAEKVSSDIESARRQTEDANSLLGAVEAKLAHLEEEIAKFRAEMESEMRQDEVRIKAAIEEESARIVASAEQEIGVAAAQARRGLRQFAADLAIDQASRQIVLTPETDRALIAEFVSDAAKGSRN